MKHGGGFFYWLSDLGLVIMSPKAKDFHHMRLRIDLINQAVLDIDTARVGAMKIANELFRRRGIF